MVIEMEDAMFEELEDIVKGIFEIYPYTQGTANVDRIEIIKYGLAGDQLYFKN